MNDTTGADSAIACIDDMLAGAPPHLIQQWADVREHLRATKPDPDGEIAAASQYEDDLLKRVYIGAHTFSGGDRNIEITVEFPFSVKEWAGGYAHIVRDADETTIPPDDQMLAFYQKQEAEKRRIMTLIRTSLRGVVLDCLRRTLARDRRQGKDSVVYALRHAAWLEGGRTDPRPHPEGEPLWRTKTITQ